MAVGSISSQYQVDWDIVVVSQDVANNTSNVYGRLIVRKTGGYGYWSAASNSWYVDFAGQIFQGNYTYDFRNYNELLLWEGTVTIQHNPDGTRSIHTGAAASMDSPSGNGSADVDRTLPTIPRASSGSLSAAPVTDVQTTINISRASSSFKHDVKWVFGNKSGVIATGVDTSVNWTPSHNMLKEIPNSAKGTGGITITTKNGSNVIGTTDIPFTLTANPNQVPSISSVTLAETVTSPVNIASVIGAYVKSQSKLRYTFSGAAGIQGSTIKSYDIKIGSLKASGSTGITDPLLNSGSVTVTATVTDTRGRVSNPWTTTIQVLAWSPPNISKFTAERALSSGVLDPAGTYIKVTLQGSVSSLSVNSSQKNTLAYRTDTSVAGADSWTNKRNTSQGTTLAVNTTYLINPYVETSSWDVLTKLTDRFATTSVLRSVTVASVALDLGLTNAGIGKMWAKGAADVGGDLVTNEMNGMFGSVIMPRGVIPPRATKQSLGSSGVSYYRAAVITGGSAGTSVLMDFYGGSDRRNDSEYSARIHFRQRNSNNAKVEVWEFGPSPATWYLKQISEFAYELWVRLAGYDDTHALIPAATTYDYGNAVQVYMDSYSSTAPSGLISTNVIVHPDIRQLDTAPFQPGANGFTYASGFSGLTAFNWNGVWITREGNLVSISGAISKSGSWADTDTVINIPSGWRPAYQMQGMGCQILAASSSGPGTRLALPAGSSSASFGITYIASA